MVLKVGGIVPLATISRDKVNKGWW